MTRKILDIPKYVEQEETLRTWTSWVDSLYTPLYVAGDNRPTHELMGITGFAFRMQMQNEMICSSSTVVFDWQRVFTESALRLGYKSSFYYGRFENAYLPHVSDHFPLVDDNRQAIEAIRSYIDAGKPVIAFDLFLPEFGVIYGYDDEKRVLYAMDAAKEEGGEFPYEKLGQTYSLILCVGALDEPVKIDQAEALRQALQFAVDHARGRDIYASDCYTTGLAAYDLWIKHLEKGPGTIDKNVNAYVIAVFADARANAVTFLREASVSEAVKPYTDNAAAAYERVHMELEQLCQRYPFPHGGTLTEENLRESMENLTKAKQAEEEAIVNLEKALELL
ncbi:BtrH N-terminal domain-containing protein [Brevibacillus humidisoli]|uniref:BtrH N-terminal domain-containing protein n=1 Tax=Brevibacillus humidisoli TaxID=2895522 RepID=UPI001E5A9559|nr:BtrH N-terminal domain-containing protein [Brevibacillus humidisoli]UFJ42422.1 BtrH N-terminal domain-containing protein [Brevibacillus humidisoli]